MCNTYRSERRIALVALLVCLFSFALASACETPNWDGMGMGNTGGAGTGYTRGRSGNSTGSSGSGYSGSGHTGSSVGNTPSAQGNTRVIRLPAILSPDGQDTRFTQVFGSKNIYPELHQQLQALTNSYRQLKAHEQRLNEYYGRLDAAYRGSRDRLYRERVVQRAKEIRSELQRTQGKLSETRQKYAQIRKTLNEVDARPTTLHVRAGRSFDYGRVYDLCVKLLRSCPHLQGGTYYINR